jgi:DNA-binding NarL/FixJ family response regulator
VKNCKSNFVAKKALDKDMVVIRSHQTLTNSDNRPPASRWPRASGKTARLTAAENRVLTHVSRAKTNKEIASALGISPATVKRHVEKILTKLQLRNRVEAAIYGVMINGCPLQSRPSCVMRNAQAGAESFSNRWRFDR